MNNWWLWDATVDYGRRGLQRELQRERLARECRGSGRGGWGRWLLSALVSGLVVAFFLMLLAASGAGSPAKGY
ncbi:MAG: hypothetical protein M1370_10350 [Bacteroidetes bacterium]|nr:hypothetical protein [Bacteroidota bacterium]MCL5027003.1 hypothetical protein [Chloroflexota bacterium]